MRVSRIGRTSVTYDYAAHHADEGAGDTLMVTASQTLVLIDHETRATVPVPERFRSAVSTFERAEPLTRRSAAEADVDVGAVAKRERVSPVCDEAADRVEQRLALGGRERGDEAHRGDPLAQQRWPSSAAPRRRSAARAARTAARPRARRRQGCSCSEGARPREAARAARAAAAAAGRRGRGRSRRARGLPPGRGRGRSPPARRPASNQWKAWATVTASRLASSSRGRLGACRRAARRPGALRASTRASRRAARPRSRARPSRAAGASACRCRRRGRRRLRPGASAELGDEDGDARRPGSRGVRARRARRHRAERLGDRVQRLAERAL